MRYLNTDDLNVDLTCLTEDTCNISKRGHGIFTHGENCLRYFPIAGFGMIRPSRSQRNGVDVGPHYILKGSEVFESEERSGKVIYAVC